MSPIAMSVILVLTLSVLVFSLHRRWKLLWFAKAPENRLDRVVERVWVTLKYAFGQRKLPHYPLAGVAHVLVFVGFLVLLLRSLILWGRAFEPSFNFWVLGPNLTFGLPLGHLYDLLKDVAVVVVLVGAGVFAFLRVVVKEKRMTLNWEGLAILGIIIVMMLADSLYDGAAFALRHQWDAGVCVDGNYGGGWACESARGVVAPIEVGVPSVAWYVPIGSLLGTALQGVSMSVLVCLAHAGFWTHCSLVLIFANILPYTKHFHIITAIPNVFASNLEPAGRLIPIAKGSEELMDIVGKAAERADPNEVAVGVARAEHFSWKNVLDFYSCTECGRCSDNCPAFSTGKALSPKQLIIDLRNHFYENAAAFTSSSSGKCKPIDLVPGVVAPEVFWGCTTCKACEEFCPVMIGHVDRIVDLRRSQVLVTGEFPPGLAKPFEAVETNGNPWNLSRLDRMAWAEGLGVLTMMEKPDAEVLYWVGCAASYDDRSKKVARAFARLLRAAGVEFAVLGEEESCTGDWARRAGNEYLFSLLAERNVGVLNGYMERGGARTIVTACPHCYNTLAHEYGDFGGRYAVVHHTDFLLDLVNRQRLKPKHPYRAKAVFHDSCYLGRYNDKYDAPRDVLRAISGTDLIEPKRFGRNMAFCCGAGGAQMWMEEQNRNRMNAHRVSQLLAVEPDVVVSACPFCMTMLTDGLNDRMSKSEGAGERKEGQKEGQIQPRQLDIAELLAECCFGNDLGNDLGNDKIDAHAQDSC